MRFHQSYQSPCLKCGSKISIRVSKIAIYKFPPAYIGRKQSQFQARR